MGFRLFRRIRVAPGIRINLSKGGLSLSGGVRGARVTVGRRGVRGTVGIPGTGVSYTETSGGGGSTPTSQEQGGGGFGWGTLVLVLIVIGLIVNHCSPNNGSWRQSADPTAEPTPIASPTTDVTVPIALSVATLPAVNRGGAVSLEISAASGATCEVGVPLAARTGDAPQPIVIPAGGITLVAWKAGTKAASSVITVVCTLGDQREALEMILVVK
ncbi:MAG: DUF4236 domain-containing protein [bacterium]